MDLRVVCRTMEVRGAAASTEDTAAARTRPDEEVAEARHGAAAWRCCAAVEAAVARW